MGGDCIPLDLPDRLRAAAPGVEMISIGGPTETISWSIWHRVGVVDPRWASIPYGRPLANHRYYILNESLQECPVWVDSQMYDASEVGLADGWWRDVARTEAWFVWLPNGERTFATGDRGCYLPSGDIEILARVDFQVKVRGHRIELGEVEWALRLHPAVCEAVVVMVGEHSRRRLVAHVVSSGERVDAELLRQHVASLLPQVMVPAQATWHDQLPLSANGKIDRKALTAWAPEEPSPEPAAEAVPMDGLESAIAAIWAEILGVPVVGRSDLFFDLGGNSMTAVLVTGELSDQLGADVPPRIMFDLASLADVASALRADPELGPLASAMVARLESAPA